ncbi:MAG: GNAT family N-acetyltransferase [Thermoguttaceae bacterium]
MPAAWDLAVQQSRDTWLYHMSGMGPLFRPPGSGPLTFVECRRDGKLVGGAILVVTQYRWHRFWQRQYAKGFIGPMSVSPFVIGGLGARVFEGVWQRVVEGCVAAAQSMRCDELLLHDTVQSLACLEDRPLVNRYVTSPQWRPELCYDYVIDLRQDRDVLFKNLETRCRTSIRRAREQFQVVGGTDIDNGRQIHVDLMETVYRREGMKLVGRDGLLEIWDKVYGGGFGRAFFSVLDGKPCTFTGVTRFGSVASYQHAARSEEAPSGAAALGLWSAIEWAKSEGVVWFDCNGALFETSGRERQRAISLFKRGFGGQVVQVHGARRQFRPLARATCDFIDAWGVQAKGLLRKASSFHR